MLDLSIIIATLNRGKLLLATVEQVLKQRFQNYEVWIVDQSDETVAAEIKESLAACLSDPRVHYLHLSRKGLPNARNEGLVRAAGRVVLFLDDDVLLLDDTFLDAHLEAYIDPDVGGVTGRVIERTNRNNARTTTNRITFGGRTVSNLTGTEPVRLHSLKGLNMSFRKEVFDHVGGFDRNYVGTALLEEADLSTRVARDGWALLFVPGAEVVHLSALNGGVRLESAMASEASHFRSTAYFVSKHRGRLGLLPFGFTFGLIAIVRATRWRRPSALLALARAASDGRRAWRDGPDQDLGVDGLKSGPGIQANAPKPARAYPHMAYARPVQAPLSPNPDHMADRPHVTIRTAAVGTRPGQDS